MNFKKLTTLACAGLLTINSTGLTVLASEVVKNDPTIVQSTEDLNNDGVINELDDELYFNSKNSEVENNVEITNPEVETPVEPETPEVDENVKPEVPEVPETDSNEGQSVPMEDLIPAEPIKPETPEVEEIDPNFSVTPETDENGEIENPEVPETPENEVKPDVPETPEVDENVKPEVPEVPETDSNEGQSVPMEDLIPAEPIKPETPEVEENNIFDSQMQSQNQAFGQIHYSEDLETERFIALIGEQARQIAREHDLYASVMIAQAILESNSGNSDLAKAPYFNIFGIKGSYDGESVSLNTKEDDGTGNLYSVVASFRDYPSMSESLEDYADLLTNPENMGLYYSGATKSNSSDYKESAKFLEGRYASDINYSEKLIGLIDTYDLTRFDKELGFEIKGKISDINEETGEKYIRDLNMLDYKNLAAVASSKLGYNYVWGGESDEEGGYDCSGLVQYVYKEALGINLPRTTYTQQNIGKEVSFDDLVMGDLLFFAETGETHHVAMYLGDGYYIHAPKTGDVVKVTAIDEYRPTFAKRVVDLVPVEQ